MGDRNRAARVRVRAAKSGGLVMRIDMKRYLIAVILCAGSVGSFLLVLFGAACSGSPTAPEPVSLWRALSSPCAPELPLPQVLDKPLHAATDPRVFGYVIGVWDTPSGRVAAVYQEIGGLYYVYHWTRA